YPCGSRNDLDVDWFGTVRGRLGYAFGGTLLYVTGGFAYGGVTESASYNDSAITGGVATPLNRARVSSSTTQTGWAAGAGIEQKISPSWSVKGEYQFVDLGTVSTGSGPLNNVTGTPVPVGGFLARGNSRVEFNTVRIGINYLFNAPEPLPLI
ncbi:MAG: outer membrane beta-barrel protein, partial [Rhodomicrobium sp.]